MSNADIAGSQPRTPNFPTLTRRKSVAAPAPLGVKYAEDPKSVRELPVARLGAKKKK